MDQLGDNPPVKTLGVTDHEDNAYYLLYSGRVDASTRDESDQSASYRGLSGRPYVITSTEWEIGWQHYARRFRDDATRCSRHLSLAARLHDLGKIDSRFQRHLIGHHPVAMNIHQRNRWRSR